MDMLLDTHTFLWWLAGNAALSPAAKDAISDERNAVFVSAASVWKITMKRRLGKLPDVGAIVPDFDGAIVNGDSLVYRSPFAMVRVAGALPGPSRPVPSHFDRAGNGEQSGFRFDKARLRGRSALVTALLPRRHFAISADNGRDFTMDAETAIQSDADSQARLDLAAVTGCWRSMAGAT